MTHNILCPLIDLLAETDALWAPIRDWRDNHRVVAIAERREQFRRPGFRSGSAEMRPNESNGSGNWTGFRRLVRLSSPASVAGVHSGGLATRRTGDSAAWSGCPVGPKCSAPCERWPGTKMPSKSGGVNLVPETWLTGPDGWGTKAGGRLLVALEEMFLPALVRGWVTAWSDCEGRVAYRTTEAGRAFLAAPGDEPADLPEFTGDAADAYLIALTAARNALAAAKPAKENALTIPLSAGLWPGESAAKIPPLFDGEATDDA